ncbi:tRNA (adenosine(37)-N6)-threonylcarbamoyltransferase complex dimerization subunit type 1 TsaB [Maricaulis maris]|uniref:tRNA (adenosine(37)-N6)-threonylcarbamoyltransferase complex dimerization subunit type 1 TsaB n=1 Tax=Maricaulis maris TaxID=74318 RepID=UPI00292665ED|nr:tRNA (adenosine(37)-N6)-threonylcarbamoyltransferase complex dimerization subunit type 1 TsaB [Maricaulis maris]
MARMTLLAIDTTGEHCTAALRLADGRDFVRSESIGRGHAERLAPMVEAVLADAGIAASELSRIGVTTGPGSFAGTRVGVAFARGLALACSAQCLGLSNLAVLAQQAGPCPALAVLHDAKRGEVILQVWIDGEAGLAERCPVSGIAERLAQMGLSHCAVTGSGSIHLPPGFEELGVTELDPRVMLAMTADLSPADCPPSPFYARPPDAKLPGGLSPT